MWEQIKRTTECNGENWRRPYAPVGANYLPN